MATMTHFKMSVSEYMSRPALVVRAGDDTLEAEALLDRHAITALGVVDDEGKLVGVLSRTDLVREADDEPGGTFRVAEGPVSGIMSAEPLSVSPDTPLDRAAKTMVKQHFHRVFVVEDGRPIGVLSTRDVMRAVADKKVRTPAIEIATKSVIRVEADDSLALAVDRLERSNRHGLVVTHDGWPVGTFAQVDALASRAKSPGSSVEDAMECRVLVLPPETPLYRAAQQALAMNVRRIVLMGREDLSVAGVLSSFDFCRVASARMS